MTVRGPWLVVALVAALAGCSAGSTRSDGPFVSPGTTPSASVSPTAPGPTPSASGVRPTKVLVVVLENHAQAQARARMPFLRSLADRYGWAADYRGVTHPSLPNYLAVAGGSTFGVHDDAGPSHHALTGPSVFGQALAAGRSAKVYAEAMPRPCATTSTSRYAVKHNPWPYFTSERDACARDDVPADALRADATADRLPTVGLLVPDICHDGHDCSLSVADGWLRSWLTPALESADFRTGRLAVVVTFDEDDYFAGNRVLTVVAAAPLHGIVVHARLSHLSLSRWLSEVAGAAPLRQAAGAPSLGSAFGLA